MIISCCLNAKICILYSLKYRMESLDCILLAAGLDLCLDISIVKGIIVGSVLLIILLLRYQNPILKTTNF